MSPGGRRFLAQSKFLKDGVREQDAIVGDVRIEIDDEMSSLSLVPSHYSKTWSPFSENEERKESRQHKTANVVVRGGALTFVFLAAILVTASFLMSPVIEEIFGKTCTQVLIIYTSITLVFSNLNSTQESRM